MFLILQTVSIYIIIFVCIYCLSDCLYMTLYILQKKTIFLQDNFNIISSTIRILTTNPYSDVQGVHYFVSTELYFDDCLVGSDVASRFRLPPVIIKHYVIIFFQERSSSMNMFSLSHSLTFFFLYCSYKSQNNSLSQSRV